MVSRTALLSWLLGGALAFSAQAAMAEFGGMSQKTELVSRFDRNGDGWLNAEERAAARAALHQGAIYRRGFGRESADRDDAKALAGIRLSPKQVRTYTQEPLFDPSTLRTIFITFQERDWEQELSDFYRTDVDVPATVVVDGKTYHDVGVHFRGNTSFQMVPAGYKRSMDLGFDFLDRKQRLLGVRKLELMNSAADPTFLRQALYMHIMREYIPAPRVNYVRYLGYIREIADRWLDWNRLGPLAQKYQSVIAADVKLDTRKLFPTEAFTRAVTEDNAVSLEGGPIAPPDMGLKGFAERRRAYLLAYVARQPGGGQIR